MSISSKKKSFASNAILYALFVAGAVVLVNLIGTRLFHRVDLTEKNIYTLSKASKDLVKTLPDAYQILARQGLYGDYFGFYLCDAILKVNGKGGQPVFVKLAQQDTGRCTPK